MKKQILIYFLVSISVFSCKKDIAEFEPTNPFQNIVLVENQVFDLDTISVKEIIGEKGTKIYFNREDFDIGENDKISLELKEYYNRLELISDNLNTITDKNELLESNGVIFLKFKSGDKELKLKDQKKLKIKFKKEFRKGDRIFNGVFDSINQIEWIEDKDTYITFPIIDTILSRRYGGVLTYRDKIIPVDSLDYYSTTNENLELQIENDISEINDELAVDNWWKYPDVLIDEFGWINVDKILMPDGNVSYELVLNKDNLEFVSTFLIYKDLNSFISDYRKPNDLIFANIPIKNQTSLIVLGKAKKEFYVKRVLIDENTNGILELDLKKVDSTEFEKILKK
ncbi:MULTISPECIES: hypothetical protein [Winogradskyella]|uniref:hypothetical protein n=1 Tax=Winogradskyella TaxID=286104 RepID=UPI0015C94EBF|nr:MULTISPECIES: hypothetical protein [Winogradskyella]QNK78284.1 hypothetical protein H7F37_04145 [Winogradskyella sp. PAMC22761]QXP78736.1 hypothetical protein H0I32_16265 [Winogradskyella sp. HaHa_3_26]